MGLCCVKARVPISEGAHFESPKGQRYKEIVELHWPKPPEYEDKENESGLGAALNEQLKCREM